MGAGQPNILFIMSDDHASQAISCYNKRLIDTPDIDRIANEGIRFDNVYCTNALCAPSRATILTGKYSHINGVRGLSDKFDGQQQTFPKLLQQNGYETAIVGKWHLGHGGNSDPTGFDYWNVFPGQGKYYNPNMIEMGKQMTVEGYATDVITDYALNWLNSRNKEQPFMMMVHHKAPHRPWQPPEKYVTLFEDMEIEEPVTFHDDYQNRAQAAMMADMRIEDLTENDIKGTPPENLSLQQLKKWKYQRYIKDYLRCVVSIDDNVGRLLNYLDEQNLSENTVVIYTSDQGFFLGEHGWYDKRFMFEESLRMPFVMRYPKEIQPESTSSEMVINNDFAPTILDYARVKFDKTMQGESIRPIAKGAAPANWRESIYYRYWEHLTTHNVVAHYGIRTDKYKLIYYYGDPLDVKGAVPKKVRPEWELFDLEQDPLELRNIYNDPFYINIVKELKQELRRLRVKYQDTV
ncbi:sulfatase family protein [Virgibacillus oceani]|uniref:Sulfatase n=1 Tax=Virgibacillus oceani TaxID=1479511 RepID=A0A917HB09_9BACI|nr:sulfatase [Virgibacillus oceani]GGG73106.1 sulfatase [Virgibacillus oceani]